MKKSEFFACSQFLADWPDGCSFHDVLVGVEAGDLAYVVDPDFRGWRAGALALAIEMTERKFCRAVADLLNPDKTPADELAEYMPQQKATALSEHFGDVAVMLEKLTIRADSYDDFGVNTQNTFNLKG